MGPIRWSYKAVGILREVTGFMMKHASVIGGLKLLVFADRWLKVQIAVCLSNIVMSMKGDLMSRWDVLVSIQSLTMG